MSFAKNLLAAAVTVAFATPALADNVDFIGYSNGSENVTYAITAPNTAVSGTSAAGGFLATLNGGPSFVAWCMDLYQTINFADPAYTDYSAGMLSAAVTDRIGRFFAENNPITGSVTSAAFQVALWELRYETSGPFDVSTGSAIFSGNDAVTTAAQSWLNVLGAASTPFAFYQSQAHQDIVVTPVPEPETYALMAAGLGALGWVARRRKAKDAAQG